MATFTLHLILTGPGAGHLDFDSILKALHDTGYDGYISGEFMPVPDADTGARRAIEYLRQVEHDARLD